MPFLAAAGAARGNPRMQFGLILIAVPFFAAFLSRFFTHRYLDLLLFHPLAAGIVTVGILLLIAPAMTAPRTALWAVLAIYIVVLLVLSTVGWF